MTSEEQWAALPEIPKLEPIRTTCVKPSQAIMKAILGIGPQTGKRSWEYIVPPKNEKE